MSCSILVFILPFLLRLYPTSMWGRYGTTVASVQLGRTPLLTAPSLSDRLSHSPPTSSSVFLSFCFLALLYPSSSSLSHFYVWSIWDDSRLHAARSYASSPDSPYSLRSSFTRSAHLFFGLPLLLLPCTSIPFFFIFIPLLCVVDMGR